MSRLTQMLRTRRAPETELPMKSASAQLDDTKRKNVERLYRTRVWL